MKLKLLLRFLPSFLNHTVKYITNFFSIPHFISIFAEKIKGLKIKISYNSPVVLSFSILASAVFLMQYMTSSIGYGWFHLPGHFQHANIISYFQLFSYPLGHASTEHLIGNLSFILLLGPVLEEKYGSKKLLMMIMSTTLITAILHILFFSASLLGASGVVFLFIMLISFTNASDGTIPLSFILIFLLFVGKEVINSFAQDNVSQFAHIIGGICGSMFGYLRIKK